MDAMPSELIGWVTFIGGILVTVAVVVLTRVAPRTSTKLDDQALELLQKVKGWADPNDPSVPPSPSNPSGKA